MTFVRLDTDFLLQVQRYRSNSVMMYKMFVLHKITSRDEYEL